MAEVVAVVAEVEFVKEPWRGGYNGSDGGVPVDGGKDGGGMGSCRERRVVEVVMEA